MLHVCGSLLYISNMSQCTINDTDARLQKYAEGELIVTDPPYNIGYRYEGEFTDRIDDYAALFEPMRGHRVVIIHYMEQIIADIVPVLGNPSRVVSWIANSNLPRCWRAVCWWNCTPDLSKVRVPYQNMDDKRVQELHARTGGRKLPDWWHIEQVKNVSAEKVQGYTNQIPREVIYNILKTTAAHGDVIVDPFSGTGTTAKVAQELGMSFRVSDVNPTARDLTRKRLSQSVISLNG